MDLEEGYIISNSSIKNKIISERKEFKNYKFLSLNELIEKIYGEYKDYAISYLVIEKGYDYDLISDIIKYLPFINDTNILDSDSSNIKLIKEIKQDLINCGYYQIDNIFLSNINRFPYTFINIPSSPEKDLVINYLKNNNCKINDINLYKEKYDNNIYKFDNEFNMYRFIFNEITNLYYNKNIKLSNIHIIGLDETDYYLNLFSNAYKLPISKKNKSNLLINDEINDLLNKIDNISDYNELFIDGLDILKKEVFNIIVKYRLMNYDIKKSKEFIKRIITKTNLNYNLYSDSINLSSVSDMFSDSDYVFVANFDINNYPKVIRNKSILTDEEKTLFNINTTKDLNSITRLNTINMLLHTKNIYILFDSSNELSYLNKDLNFSVLDYDPISLYGINKEIDDMYLGIIYSNYYKYNISDEALNKYDITHLKYFTYDNSYKKFDVDYQMKTISYSDMKEYFSCPYSYYLDKVLNLKVFEDTIYTKLGSYAHKMLELSYDEDFSYDEVKNRVLDNYIIKEIEDKEKYFISRMDNVVKGLIEFNKEKEDRNALDSVLREVKINYEINSKYKFKGQIDKILYKIIGNDVYLAIIDYKTGKDEMSLEKFSEGINLQLPVYINLISKYSSFKGYNIKILGIYLQKVNIILFNSKDEILKQINDSYKLTGYSISDLDKLRMLDPGYEKSEYIKSLSLTKEGKFNAHAKIFSDNDIKEIDLKVKDVIDKFIKNVEEHNFDIRPLKNKDSIGCTYCEFFDICNRKNSDIKEI